MLPRFYDADGGAVLVDGHDVREYRLQSLRDQISLVDQQVRLFNASVAENIAYGLQPTPDAARIVEAAQLAHAWEFIARKPKRLRPLIGQGSAKRRDEKELVRLCLSSWSRANQKTKK